MDEYFDNGEYTEAKNASRLALAYNIIGYIVALMWFIVLIIVIYAAIVWYKSAITWRLLEQ